METAAFLNLLKPPQMTSHDCVDFVRRRLKLAKVGHLGTLDPPAAGVLPLALGAATRLIQHLPPARKVYRAELTFGCSSDTLDAAGKILAEAPVGDLSGLAEACSRYRGDILQAPPRVSALKVQGQRSYQRARRGEDFEPAPRLAHYHRVEVLELKPPRALLEVDCGPGTYVRSLARDLGEQMGCGALLSFLVRLRSGIFGIDTAYTLEDVLHGRARLVPCERPFEEIPLVEMDSTEPQGMVRVTDREGRRGLGMIMGGQCRWVATLPPEEAAHL